MLKAYIGNLSNLQNTAIKYIIFLRSLNLGSTQAIAVQMKALEPFIIRLNSRIMVKKIRNIIKALPNIAFLGESSFDNFAIGDLDGKFIESSSTHENIRGMYL